MTIPPAKQSDWMHSLADFMIQNPHCTNIETARVFGVSAVWIGVVKRSDSFGELMKSRREVHSEMVSSSVIDKVEALAELAIEEMAARMEREVVPLEQVREIGDLALKSLGFGGRGGIVGSAGVVNNISVNVDRDALAAAREKMKLINAPHSPPASPSKQIEGELSEPVDISSPVPSSS